MNELETEPLTTSPWLTTSELADYFVVKDPKTIRNWINKGREIPGKGRVYLKADTAGRPFRVHITNLEKFEKHFI